MGEHAVLLPAPKGHFSPPAQRTRTRQLCSDHTCWEICLGWFETRPFCVQTHFHQRLGRCMPSSLLLLGQTRDANAHVHASWSWPGTLSSWAAGAIEGLQDAQGPGQRTCRGQHQDPSPGAGANTSTEAPKAPRPSSGAGSVAAVDRLWPCILAHLCLAVQGPGRNGVCHQQVVRAGVALGPAPS